MKFHLHLVSDFTGETVTAVARACLSQFEDAQVIEHPWWLVRAENQVSKVIEGIARFPGIVLCTLVDNGVRSLLEEACRRLGTPCIAVLDPVMGALAAFTGAEIRALPGQQHALSAEYFRRIDAIHFTLAHDDGRVVHDLNDADIIVVGVSRTSKTPTCMYLAYRGLKVANVPFVPGIELPAVLFEASYPLIVGLTRDPCYLVDIRCNRVQSDIGGGSYTSYEEVKSEVQEAQRLFTRQRWPVIDMTARSIEEAAATILHHHARYQEMLSGEKAREPGDLAYRDP